MTFPLPEDRMPTMDEIRNFDAAAAWDRLTPDQQCTIGILAVECAALAVPQSYQGDYTPAELNEINALESDALTLFVDGAEPLLQFVYGWDHPVYPGRLIALQTTHIHN